MGEKLTKNDIEKIEKEIEYRKLELRPKILADLKEARAQGDLSENFEYYTAKRERNKNDSRIRYLEKMIKFADVIEDNLSDDEAGLDKSVKVRFENTGKEEVLRLVTPIRGDSIKKFISIESPVGVALLGHKVGETVTVCVNASMKYDLTILEVKPADDSNDTIRQY